MAATAEKNSELLSISTTRIELAGAERATSCAGAEQEQLTASSAGTSDEQQQLVVEAWQRLPEQQDGPAGFEQQGSPPAALHGQGEPRGWANATAMAASIAVILVISRCMRQMLMIER